METNKKVISPNECSAKRWIMTGVVGYLLGALLTIPQITLTVLFPGLETATWCGLPMEPLLNVFTFVPMFIGMAIALRLIAKTTLKDFILGVGGRLDKKQALTFAGLQLLGVAATCLFSFPYISWRGVPALTFAVLAAFMLLVVWMQTSWEELVFRGLFLRWACKNEIGFSKKSLAALAMSSVFFGLLHLSNPELSGMSGLELAVGAFCYIFIGIVYYLADLEMGSLVPGLVLHLVNNFTIFTLVSSDKSAVPVPTLFADGSPATGGLLLLSTVIVSLPTLIYIALHHARRRRA